MRCLVVYSSVTGNTKALAEAVCEVMPPGTELFPVWNAPPPDAYDFLALGFWVYRAAPDPRMRRYMATVNGKTAALFGTLAAYPDSDHARKVIVNAGAMLGASRIAGTFLCQGKLAPKRLEARLNGTGKGHPMTPERRARLLEAEKHPNEHDFAMAREAFARFLQDAAI